MKITKVESVHGSTQKGAMDFRYLDGKLAGCGYICPHCGQEDYMPIDPLYGWSFSGTEDAPTLLPSILHGVCNWHGYLTNGEWVPA